MAKKTNEQIERTTPLIQNPPKKPLLTVPKKPVISPNPPIQKKKLND